MHISTPRVMVCVTVQKTCERLIRAGAILSKDGELNVVHVAQPGAALLGNANESDALEYLYHIAREYGAEMTMLRSSSAMDSIVTFARTHQIGAIVVGLSRETGDDSFARTLQGRLPDVAIHAISE